MTQENQQLRTSLESNAKMFKTSWIFLGQALYSVYKDKLFHAWGYEKFEDYTTKELGLKKSVALKLVKTYWFVEQHEPEYLKEEMSQKDAAIIPSYEPLDLLRKAKSKDLTREDYQKVREQVFSGKDASLIKKDLTAMIKERKQVDPDVERDKRNQAAIKKIMGALNLFNGEMKALKLIESDILEKSEGLLKIIQEKYS